MGFIKRLFNGQLGWKTVASGLTLIIVSILQASFQIFDPASYEVVKNALIAGLGLGIRDAVANK